MKKLIPIFLALASIVFAQQGQLASSYTASGTDGAGYLQLANQSSAPSTPTSAGRVYFDTSNLFAWKNAGGFIGKIDLGGAARTITLSGNPTLGDWFDQAVKSTSSPTFAALTVSGAATLGTDSTVTASAANANFAINSVGGSGRQWILSSRTDGTFKLRDATGSADLYSFSTTGLAVTGALSATGTVTITKATGGLGLSITSGNATPTYIAMGGSGGNVAFVGSADQVYGGSASDAAFAVNGANNAVIATNGVARGTFSSTGLAVTGTLNQTGGSGSLWTYSGGGGGLELINSSDTSATKFISFDKSTGTTIGSISRVTTTDAVAYNTTSDARLKENFRDFTDSGRLIDALRPRVFDWKSATDSDGKNVIGFIAQEENAADPVFAHIGAVTVGDDDPNTITRQWQRSDSALIPILVAEIKALRARVQALENK